MIIMLVNSSPRSTVEVSRLDGAITLEEVCQRYNLSVEEFLSWQEMIDKHGVRGLRVTRLQDYRAP